MTTSLLARYRAGESVQVWDALIALGPSVRDPGRFREAYAVALDTMGRVRRNVETIHRRLIDVGYRFACPDSAHLPAPPDAAEVVAEIEGMIGPLPLSLRAFYEVVGSVDFRQSPEQLSHGWDRESERAQLPELSILGEEDPLVVAPISELIAAARAAPGRSLYFCFAPDEFHKANYSGGENYHVSLPDARVDFRIYGMYDIGEYFVEHLRASCAGGGFRGRLGPIPDPDDERSFDAPISKQAPELKIIEGLAAGLLPV